MTPRWVVYDEPAGGGGGGGGPWDPSQLSALWGWYKADAVTGVSDGSTLSTWSDSSGNGNDLTLNSGAVSTFETNELNALPVVRMSDSANLSGTYEAPVSETGVTDVFFCGLVKPSEFVQAARYAVVFRDSGNRRARFGRLNMSRLFARTDGNTTYDFRPNATQISITNYMIFTGRISTSNGTIDITENGTAYSATATPAPAVIGDFDQLWISPDDSGDGWFGDWAEIVLAIGAVSDAEIQKSEGYLAHKWGLAGNLPVSHPYKNAAP